MRLARAKTNLFLEVTREGSGGFHELDTVFVELELADTIEISDADRLSLSVHGDASIPAGPDNLMWRAADALRRHARRPDLGAALRVDKTIPPGGGLGGGSSNAAATLLALDTEWNLDTAPEDLRSLAAELGSDVPFFLRGGIQRGRGRGELLEAIPPLTCPLHMVLVFPEFGCPTREVYRSLAPFLPSQPRSPAPLLDALAAGDPRRVGRHMFNRLELAALACFPALSEIKAELSSRAGVVCCLLSGSGSTFVCLTVDAKASADLAYDLERCDYRALSTRSAAPR